MTPKLAHAEQLIEDHLGNLPKTGATTFVFAFAQMTTEDDKKWSACQQISLQDIETHDVIRCFNNTIDRLMAERTEFIERKARDLANTIREANGTASKIVDSLGYSDDQLLEACIRILTESADD